LTFAPLAWLKLHYLCHAGPTEVGGFALTGEHDPLYVEDFVTVGQEATPLSVRFFDNAVADYFDRCIDLGLPPGRFARVWCHTHPGASAEPSGTDEETFARCFGRCDWAVMFILSRQEQTYARLTFTAGPGGSLLIPTVVDWAAWPGCVEGQENKLAAVMRSWQQEYTANVHRPLRKLISRDGLDPFDDRGWWEQEPWSADLDTTRFRTVKEPENGEPVNDDRPA
jgi:hypothetical protein